jgi:hypothetical protein
LPSLDAKSTTPNRDEPRVRDLTVEYQKYSGSITHGALTWTHVTANIPHMPDAPRQPGCDTQEAVLVHRAFRREFGLLPRMVRAVAGGDRARAAIVASHALTLLDALRRHHEAEDALIWPRLHARAEVPQALVYLMESQHAAVAELMQLTDALVGHWAATAATASREELAVVLDNLAAALIEHIEDEERSLLPIVARTLTADDWAAVCARGVDGIAGSCVLIVFGTVLEDATEHERAAFLKKLPVAARVQYRLVGRRRYRDYAALLRADVAGNEVAPTPASHRR